MKAEGKTVSYKFSYDLSEECKAEMIAAGEDFFVTASEGSFSFFCSNDDVSALNGLSESELYRQIGEVCGQTLGALYYYHHTYYEGPGFQQPEADVVQDYGLMATSDGEMCIFTLEGQNVDLNSECVNVFYTTENIPEKNNFTERVMKGLTGTIGPKWYAGGTVEITENNWTGSIIYQGSETAPSFTMTNGAETVEGTLAADHISPSLVHSGFGKMRRSLTGVRLNNR